VNPPAEARPPLPPGAAPAVSAQHGAELGDEELEQVVGGLARVYVPTIWDAQA
jgi:hypothetical protein